MPIPHLNKPSFQVRKIGSRFSRFRKYGTRWEHLKYFIRRNWFFIIVAFILVFFLFGVGTFAWFSKDLPDPDKIIERNLVQSTKIFASDEKTLLYEIHGPEKRTVIELEDVPDIAIQATIAIEDKDFYKHGGFSITGIIKGLCHEAIGNLGGLCPPRGGSTITQQFVKNAILTSERSYARKIKELILSYQLESKFTKDQILKMYMNEIPYGSSAYGIESASQTFLNKSARDLTLSEAAFLAALPQLPTYYSPYGNRTDELSTRLHVILNEMVEQGYITEEQATEAKNDNILARLRPKYENILAPHFVMYVKEQLTNKYGETVVEQGGLKVVTTLNIDKQRIAEEVLEKQAEKNAKNYNASNAALVSLDTKTGQILAMVGSKDYFDESIDGNVNVVLRPRQPGSSFKPIVYLTAFSKGYTPETILFDLVTKFKTDTKDYEPKNYDLVEHGPVSMRQALAGSLNIPAVKTLYLAGIDAVLDVAEKLGYSTFTDRSRYGLSLVLGGGEVTLLEHTSAYATLAREGIRHPVASILRVEDNRGKVLEQFEEREERVLEEELVRKITSVLSDNAARSYIFGSRNYLTLPDRPVAAKTGTTNDYRDAWTLGYTPSFATGVWVGNNDNSEMRRGADGSVIAAPIWNEYMKRTVGGPVEPFKAPRPNNSTKPVLQGKLESETKLKVDKYTEKLIPDSCLASYPVAFISEKTFRAVHDILNYVDRNDPTGDPLSNLAAEPQYDRWEEPVRRWAQANNYLEIKPAAENCELRAEKNWPTVSITAPVAGETVPTPILTASATATAVTGRVIKSVTFYLDEKLIGTATIAPYTITYTIEGLTNGFHDLKAVAVDDIQNTGSLMTTINYLVSNGEITNTNTGL